MAGHVDISASDEGIGDRPAGPLGVLLGAVAAPVCRDCGWRGSGGSCSLWNFWSWVPSRTRGVLDERTGDMGDVGVAVVTRDGEEFGVPTVTI